MTDWVPFSVRYGIHSAGRFPELEGSTRHLDTDIAPEDRRRCDCLGTSHVRCSLFLDREDMVCAECRDWCWGVTPSGERVALERLVRAS